MCQQTMHVVQRLFYATLPSLICYSVLAHSLNGVLRSILKIHTFDCLYFVLSLASSHGNAKVDSLSFGSRVL